jgi:hypothetical protein
MKSATEAVLAATRDYSFAATLHVRDAGLARTRAQRRRFRAHERKVQVWGLCSAALALASCVDSPESATLDVDGPFAVVAPDCASTSTPLGVGVLDLASAPTNYLALFASTADSPSTVARAELHYSLERGGFDDATLASPSVEVAEGCGEECGTHFNEISLALVDENTSTRLAADAAVSEIIRENGRVRLDVAAVLHGFNDDVANYGSEARPTAAAESMSAVIDLCSGCLAGPSTCANGAAPVVNPAQCIAGVDVPDKVCP